MDEKTFNQGNGICWHVVCLNNLGDGWIQTLDSNPLPSYLWLMHHWNGIVKYVMINGQLHLDWPSHWPSDDLTIIVLDDSEFPDVRDPEWEAAEAEYENGDVIDCLRGRRENPTCI